MDQSHGDVDKNGFSGVVGTKACHGFKRETEVRRLKVFAVKGSIK